MDERNKIFVIDDGCRSFTECPTAQDAQILMDLGGGDDSSYGDEDSDKSSDQESKASQSQDGVNKADYMDG